MAYDFTDLKDTYGQFKVPRVRIYVNGTDISDSKKESVMISGVRVELTCGYEAGMATFELGGVFNRTSSTFDIEELTKLIPLGSSVRILMGYDISITEVFTGYIANVRFTYTPGQVMTATVTCMDIKGIMMGNKYNAQLKANSYSEALKEILDRTNYANLIDANSMGESSKPFTKLSIDNTPDYTDPATAGDDSTPSAFSIELVEESDYEFAVRAAKKFNYEFFCVGNTIYFRPARSNTDELIQLGADMLITYFDAEFNIMGLSKSVEVRGVDVNKAKLITKTVKSSQTISRGSKAKGLLASSKYVVTDPTVNSNDEAEIRANAIMDKIENRWSTLTMEFVGLPEIIPGRFVSLKHLTYYESDLYYITNVVHTMRDNKGFTTKITAYSKSVDTWNNSGGTGLI